MRLLHVFTLRVITFSRKFTTPKSKSHGDCPYLGATRVGTGHLLTKIQTDYGAQSMRTEFIVIATFNGVPFFVFCTTKTHVIVHLYPKLPHLMVSWA